MHVVTTLIIVALLMAGAWWLSGYDSGVTGENRTDDFIRRAVRCGVTVLLIFLATLTPYFAIFIFVALAVLWASCLAEFFTRRLQSVVDPEDDREFDPKATERNMDLLGQMIRQGRTREALEFCKKLQASGEANPLALEATVHRVYQQILDSIDTSPFLREVRELNKVGKFEEAESRLKQILVAQPDNWAAMLLLMRIYVKGLARPVKALAYVQADEHLHLPPAFFGYARRSISRWVEEAAHPEGSEQKDTLASHFERFAAGPELSLDELLKNNQLATAVERLENDMREQPRNFDLWLKLAEVYAVNCSDSNRAGKIVQKMEKTSAFTAEQIQLAKSKLRDWQKIRRA
jgi:tetratricopeptide (TPR) repeat protein